MDVVGSQYSEKYQVLGYRFDTGATLFFGIGVLPGTDIVGYRYVLSRGFKDQVEYKEAQSKANEYSRRSGYNGVLGHFKSFNKAAP